MSGYQLDHLQHLETEAIHLMRECAGEFERPALLFSGGKDSICLLRLAEKAFRPSELPLPLLNVDTGHHFPELNEFRDRRAAQLGARLIVRRVEDAIAQGLAEVTARIAGNAEDSSNQARSASHSAEQVSKIGTTASADGTIQNDDSEQGVDPVQG